MRYLSFLFIFLISLPQINQANAGNLIEAIEEYERVHLNAARRGKQVSKEDLCRVAELFIPFTRGVPMAKPYIRKLQEHAVIRKILPVTQSRHGINFAGSDSEAIAATYMSCFNLSLDIAKLNFKRKQLEQPGSKIKRKQRQRSGTKKPSAKLKQITTQIERKKEILRGRTHPGGILALTRLGESNLTEQDLYNAITHGYHFKKTYDFHCPRIHSLATFSSDPWNILYFKHMRQPEIQALMKQLLAADDIGEALYKIATHTEQAGKWTFEDNHSLGLTLMHTAALYGCRRAQIYIVEHPKLPEIEGEPALGLEPSEQLYWLAQYIDGVEHHTDESWHLIAYLINKLSPTLNTQTLTKLMSAVVEGIKLPSSPLHGEIARCILTAANFIQSKTTPSNRIAKQFALKAAEMGHVPAIRTCLLFQGVSYKFIRPIIPQIMNNLHEEDILADLITFLPTVAKEPESLEFARGIIATLVENCTENPSNLFYAAHIAQATGDLEMSERLHHSALDKGYIYSIDPLHMYYSEIKGIEYSKVDAFYQKAIDSTHYIQGAQYHLTIARGFLNARQKNTRCIGIALESFRFALTLDAAYGNEKSAYDLHLRIAELLENKKHLCYNSPEAIEHMNLAIECAEDKKFDPKRAKLQLARHYCSLGNYNQADRLIEPYVKTELGSAMLLKAAILTAKIAQAPSPEEARGILAEVAGISKHKRLRKSRYFKILTVLLNIMDIRDEDGNCIKEQNIPEARRLFAELSLQDKKLTRKLRRYMNLTESPSTSSSSSETITESQTESSEDEDTGSATSSDYAESPQSTSPAGASSCSQLSEQDDRSIHQVASSSDHAPADPLLEEILDLKHQNRVKARQINRIINSLIRRHGGAVKQREGSRVQIVIGKKEKVCHQPHGPNYKGTALTDMLCFAEDAAKSEKEEQYQGNGKNEAGGE